MLYKRSLNVMSVVESVESVVAQWLAHLPLVLEVPGSIPARGEENFGVRTRFSSVICRDDTR